MKIEPLNDKVALVRSEGAGPVLTDLQSALDLMGEIWTLEDRRALIVLKEEVDESLFDLSTRVLGEILQKFANYRMRIGIVGDFGGHDSKALKDFIYESNKGRVVCFVDTVEEAVTRLSQ